MESQSEGCRVPVTMFTSNGRKVVKKRKEKKSVWALYGHSS